MSNLSSKISDINAYSASGANKSALAIFGEILPDFLQELYPISLPKKPKPKFLIHYTSLDTLFSMLDREKPGHLRLYDTIHSNDPTEGTFFRDYLKRSSPSCYSSLPPFILNHHPGYAYISSFVRTNKESERDKLVYWLAYGRNGYGCSIAIPYSYFDPGLPILPVQYGKSAVRKTAQRLISFFNHLLPSFQQYFAPGFPAGSLPPQFKALSSIPYFHKPKSYSYETECRIFLSPLDHLCDPKYQPRYSSEEVPTVRHYVEHDPLRLGGIFFTGTVITLGPSIPKPENIRKAICALLRYHGLSGPNVVFSKIPYRPPST